MPTKLDKLGSPAAEALLEVDDGILTVAGEIAMPLGTFPRRMTVVRLSGQRTAIHSAIASTSPRWRALD